MIVVIEGGDQAGKKTQTELLSKALKKRKIKTATFSFPDYTTPIGKEIEKYLSGKRKFPPQTIHCLLAAILSIQSSLWASKWNETKLVRKSGCWSSKG
jgi:dTMP kinase